MYTVPFLSLHAIAASRGDGLHPELLALFERLAAASEVGPTAVELGRYQAEGILNARPGSASPDDAALPESVVRFPADPKSALGLKTQVPEASRSLDASQRQ